MKEPNLKTDSIPTIMSRIKAAQVRSPIAVFKQNGGLKAMFANTINAQARINMDDRHLVGVFTRHDNERTVRERLRRASN